MYTCPLLIAINLLFITICVGHYAIVLGRGGSDSVVVRSLQCKDPALSSNLLEAPMFV